MKNTFPIVASALIGLVVGFVLAQPDAGQWDVVVPYQRFGPIVLFFGISTVLSLAFLALTRRASPVGDFVRAACLMLGAALCCSIVRQEVTLLVYAALWAPPGTFLGTALGKLFWERAAVSESESVTPQEVEACSP